MNIYPGLIFWLPKEDWYIEVLSINEGSHSPDRPWFNYKVIKGYTGSDRAGHKFDQGSCSKHNGWDYTGEIVNNWIPLTEQQLKSKTRFILYGQGQGINY